MTILALLNPILSGNKKPERFGLPENVVARIDGWWSGIDLAACREMVTLIDQLLAEHLQDLAGLDEPVPERCAEEFRAACLAYLFSKVRDDALGEIAAHIQGMRNAD
ncbi:MAG: hypothetical protein KBE09_05515 [Candidatus Pacebacteria bacterium]|nr:hypothetical protein [Candidatus Paceibacterota bacterium]